jgi:Bromodomain
VVALKEPGTKRRLADLFLEKPAPQQFPDYYELIDKPIAINDILRKCRGKMYTHFFEYRDDWKLMIANAVKFNGEGSWVVKDILALEKELDRVLKKNGFTEEALPSPGKKKSPKKKLRIKLSLRASVKSSEVEGEGDEEDEEEGEEPPPPLEPTPKKKRARRK